MKFTAKDGAEYGITEFGSVKQTNAEPYKYDENYISRDYDKPEYKENARRLSLMRYVFACTSHGRPPHSICEIGYGKGDFLSVAIEKIPFVYGFDVTGLPVPEDCIQVSELVPAEIYCYFDVLEHILDLSFVKDIPAETLIISLPNLRIHPEDPRFEEWFETWKHRKKDEHIHYFDAESLKRTIESMGWKMVATLYHEDFVRTNAENNPNILSMAFKRK